MDVAIYEKYNIYYKLFKREENTWDYSAYLNIQNPKLRNINSTDSFKKLQNNLLLVISVSESILKEILREVKELRRRVEKIENLVEERLVGVEEPMPDEIEAIKEYEKAKKKGSVNYVKLEDI